MFRFFNYCSQGRGAWLLMAFTAFMLECAALYFQHVMKLQPCVMCIYERVALLGVMFAGLIGAIAPRNVIIRWVAIVVWIYAAWRGLDLAWEHTMLQLYPSPFASCDFFVNFPDWLPLQEWVPAMFEATGDCSVRQWAFLGLDMPQWLIGIFAAYILVAVIVLISQFFPAKKSF
ncbi:MULTISPECIES: disulfide bond formation protein DsbB [Providencia]|uniref:disulfide bond formation protein DsbB n=1 Tax=Providencia TaxID=586 RepID=UPI001C5BC1FA|nr:MULTISPECIES: disulfide bond formation protein DsbB [Providencia]MDR2224488.1 disulfide bond formation protein DsbB [Providencia sp.]QXX83941.1 disulfide bond formation protein DsbB [Providencia sp. R33]